MQRAHLDTDSFVPFGCSMFAPLEEKHASMYNCTDDSLRRSCFGSPAHKDPRKIWKEVVYSRKGFAGSAIMT